LPSRARTLCKYRTGSRGFAPGYRHREEYCVETRIVKAVPKIATGYHVYPLRLIRDGLRRILRLIARLCRHPALQGDDVFGELPQPFGDGLKLIPAFREDDRRASRNRTWDAAYPVEPSQSRSTRNACARRSDISKGIPNRMIPGPGALCRWIETSEGNSYIVGAGIRRR
jgi:hypothetical protein